MACCQYISHQQLSLRKRTFFAEEVRRYVDHVKSAAPAAGVDKVRVPGEPELERMEARRRDGVELPDDVWGSILEAADKVGLSREEARSIAGVN
jgi:LDH2 family malate/lactate/ureidoglycolate dehydrogenase